MQNQPKVTIGIVLFKGEKYLPYSLNSLISQDYSNIEFLFRDQSPEGEAYEFIKEKLPEVFKKAKVFKGGNLWHSGGHNDLINQMTGDYYICASYDMWYPQNFVSKMVEKLEDSSNQSYGTLTPKLMYWDFPALEKGELLKNSLSNQIDSCGIAIRKNHHFYDLGQGEIDQGLHDDKKDLFGPSGALIVFRKSALQSIAYKNESGKKEYFDELIHYKNDVDLAYRLQWAGQKCLFLPEIKVYHDRQVRNMEESKSFWMRIVKSRDGLSNWAKESSFFGHQMVLKKNFSSKFSWEVKLKTYFYNWIKLLYVTLFESYLLKQFKKVKSLKKEIAKRKATMNKVVEAKEIEKYMLS